MLANSEAQKAIHTAIILLINNRNDVKITKEQLLTLCRTDSDYALDLIEKNKTQLLNARGESELEIIDLIYCTEWNLLGTTEFLIRNKLEFQFEDFVINQLTQAPADFTHEDLLFLLKEYKRDDHPIRIDALNLLNDYVISFAERLASEPLEMSEDLESLKKSIHDYGFDVDLNATLQKIDNDLQKDSDAFDQKATMGHIRSFFERVLKNICEELQRAKPELSDKTPLHKFGKAIDYLKRKDVITEEIEALAKALYSILSDDHFGVHALKANRDYTRLCRNMVIEYAVTLFFELERRLAE